MEWLLRSKATCLNILYDRWKMSQNLVLLQKCSLWKFFSICGNLCYMTYTGQSGRRVKWCLSSISPVMWLTHFEQSSNEETRGSRVTRKHYHKLLYCYYLCIRKRMRETYRCNDSILKMFLRASTGSGQKSETQSDSPTWDPRGSTISLLQGCALTKSKNHR